jgi:hypothetical protein
VHLVHDRQRKLDFTVICYLENILVIFQTGRRIIVKLTVHYHVNISVNKRTIFLTVISIWYDSESTKCNSQQMKIVLKEVSFNTVFCH